MIVRDLGLIEYAKALDIQESARDNVISGEGAEILLVCEHPSVITVGRALGSSSEIFSRDIPVFEISRGGRSTLHLPGQLVMYPILDLKKRGRDLHGYLRNLEEAIISTLEDFKIEACRIEGKTGVWVANGTKKIASLGIAVKNGVTTHGLSLNVTCDLKSFSALNPCGFDANIMTSVDNELQDGQDKELIMESVKSSLVENLLMELVAY